MPYISLLLASLFFWTSAFAESYALYSFESNNFSPFVKVIQKGGASQLPKTMMRAILVKDPKKNPFQEDNIVSQFFLNDKRDAEGDYPPYLTFIEDESLESCIEGGIKADRKGIIQKLKYAALEGQGGGRMDFRFACEYYDEDRVYFIDGVAYNTYDLGNFLWGAGMKRLGISFPMTKIGSQLNAVFNTYRQNEYLEKPWHGLALKGDSPEDQRAIKHGYKSKFGKAKKQE